MVEPDRAQVDPNATESFDMDWSDGHYIFMPEWSDALPRMYGKLNKEIHYQKGALLDQWVILQEDADKGEQGMIIVRTSPKYWNEIIEFEVLLNPIFVDDFKSKDITMNW